jgi:hypothetical protein
MKSVKCPSCGFVGFSSSTCKRCQRPFGTVENEVTDEKTLASIKAGQGLILGVGATVSLFLAISTYFFIEDLTTMALTFAGIVGVGFTASWAIGSMLERRMLGGKNLNYKISAAEKSAVFGASLFAALMVCINTNFGYVLAPLIVISFNGALYLYEFQMKRQSAFR